MEQRISLVTLGVNNLSSARSFYETLGWGGAEQPDDEVCIFQAGGLVFGLWTALGGHGAPGIELAYNVRSPEEVSAVLAEAQHAGGRIVRLDNGLFSLETPRDRGPEHDTILAPRNRWPTRGSDLASIGLNSF